MDVPRFSGRMSFVFGKKRLFDDFYMCGRFFLKLHRSIGGIGNMLNIGLDLGF